MATLRAAGTGTGTSSKPSSSSSQRPRHASCAVVGNSGRGALHSVLHFTAHYLWWMSWVCWEGVQ